MLTERVSSVKRGINLDVGSVKRCVFDDGEIIQTSSFQGKKEEKHRRCCVCGAEPTGIRGSVEVKLKSPLEILVSELKETLSPLKELKVEKPDIEGIYVGS